MPQGKVKWFSTEKAFGFIEQENDNDIFVHVTGLADGVTAIDKDMLVEYEVEQGRKGPQATKVRPVAGAAAPAAEGPVPAKKTDVGTVAAIGVALGSVGTFVAMIFAKFVDLGPWIPVAVIGLILVISGPSMLIAWLKLRQRNLGPILDANGWAVNARAKVNVAFGGALTAVASLPLGAERSMSDAYADKKSPWPAIIVLAIMLALPLLMYFRHDSFREVTDAGLWKLTRQALGGPLDDGRLKELTHGLLDNSPRDR